MATLTNRKVRRLYEHLEPLERARMQARLARTHDVVEMDRLREATPIEQAQNYNRALSLLRLLNGHAPFWIGAFHLGMERDRLRLQNISATSAYHLLIHAGISDVWKLVRYPVTESEYRAIVHIDRAELEPVSEYASMLFESGHSEGLRRELAAILREQRDGMIAADEEALWDRFYGCFVSAIKGGDLPRPKRKPKDATSDVDPDEPWLPSGALKDWAEGTTEATYAPRGPGFAVPALDELFGGGMAEWDIRPDWEANEVVARREQLRASLLSLFRPLIPRSEWDRLPSLGPPLTPRKHELARKQANTLWHDLFERDELAELALDIAKSHAIHRTQLEDLSFAIQAIMTEEFGAEDPIRPEVRSLLEGAQEEARRFEDTWETVQTTMGLSLRRAMGLDPYVFVQDENESLPRLEPVPLPTVEHDSEGMLKFLRDWG